MSQTKPMTKPAPLGRGLSALFGDADASYQPKPIQPKAAVAPAQNERGLRTMPLAWLQPGSYQPRRHFDEDAIKGLAQSIQERGILEPLLVRSVPNAKDAFEIIAGERRWRAAQIAGLHEVPVVVREITDREALEFGLIENIQRQDLSPLEESEGYQRLIDEFNYTQENLAKIVGKSRPHITNMLRLLTLPAAVKQMIEMGDLTLGHARALITCKDPVALAKEIARKGLNVRQAESLANQSKGKVTAKRSENTTESSDVVALEKELERVIGLKVKVKTEGKAGSLTLFYKDLDQLDDIIKKLRG
ncbi:MAG: ParB/RepB/Spo0J family partition protein [Alphaproteobacteria bacterium]